MKRSIYTLISVLILISMALSACQSAGPTKVRVVMDATWPPFEITDEATKEVKGYDVDLMKAVAKKANFDIEFINQSFDSDLAGMAQCSYDVMISALTITDERKKNMAFSDPYFAAGQIVSVKFDNATINSKDDLKGKKVGGQLGTTGAIIAEKMEGSIFKSYDDIGMAFQDVMNGQLDAVIADNPLALGYVAQNKEKLKTVGPVFTDEQYGIAVCKTKTELLQKINKALADLKSEGYMDELMKKWISK